MSTNYDRLVSPTAKMFSHLHFVFQFPHLQKTHLAKWYSLKYPTCLCLIFGITKVSQKLQQLQQE